MGWDGMVNVKGNDSDQHWLGGLVRLEGNHWKSEKYENFNIRNKI